MTDFTLVQKIAIWALPILSAIIVHEVAHGWVALKLGDQTARLSGRLTLNPVSHVDLVGTIIVPLFLLVMSGFIFGWAKPVPVDARNLRYPQRDMAIVAAAGPGSNFLMALFWAAIAKIGYSLNAWAGVPMIYMGHAGIMINIALGVLNCLPIPPLDGGRVVMSLAPKQVGWYLYRLEPYGFFILLALMFTGVLSFIMLPFMAAIQGWILQLFGLY